VNVRLSRDQHRQRDDWQQRASMSRQTSSDTH
jgi:hypothetical protein